MLQSGWLTGGHGHLTASSPEGPCRPTLASQEGVSLAVRNPEQALSEAAPSSTHAMRARWDRTVEGELDLGAVGEDGGVGEGSSSPSMKHASERLSCWGGRWRANAGTRRQARAQCLMKALERRC